MRELPATVAGAGLPRGTDDRDGYLRAWNDSLCAAHRKTAVSVARCWTPSDGVRRTAKTAQRVESGRGQGSGSHLSKVSQQEQKGPLRFRVRRLEILTISGRRRNRCAENGDAGTGNPLGRRRPAVAGVVSAVVLVSLLTVAMAVSFEAGRTNSSA